MDDPLIAIEYMYKVHVIRVVDGDTVDVEVDLGFDIKIKKRVRLHGIDAPEIRTRDKQEKIAGYKSKEFLEQVVKDNDGMFYMSSQDKGKYGRCIGILFEKDFYDESLNDRMIYEGHAKPYKK